MPTFITPAEVLATSGLPTDYSIVARVDVDLHIDEAERVVQRLLNLYFTVSTTTGVTVTDEEYDGSGTDILYLRHTPVSAVTALSTTTDYGTSYTTITTTKLWVDADSGKVQLKPNAEVTYFPSSYPKSVKVSYRHGMVPLQEHKRLMRIVAALSVLAEQMGGTFDDPTSYSLPEYTVSKGEPYTNIRATFEILREEYNRLMETVLKPQPFVMC